MGGPRYGAPSYPWGHISRIAAKNNWPGKTYISPRFYWALDDLACDGLKKDDRLTWSSDGSGGNSIERLADLAIQGLSF